MKPKRMTRAEADARVAHLSPAERRQAINAFLEALAIRGIDAQELFDAAGRSYISVDLDQVRRVAPDLVPIFEAVEAVSPLPVAHQVKAG